MCGDQNCTRHVYVHEICITEGEFLYFALEVAGNEPNTLFAVLQHFSVYSTI